MFDSLIEFLRTYGIFGALFITAPTAIGVMLYSQVWRNRKSLSYEILTLTSLFDVNSEVKHRIEVLLDGKPVKDIQLVIIEIQNDGFQPIEEKDFSTPISIDFGSFSEIFSVDKNKSEPKDLPVNFTFDKFKIEVEPLLLNKKDSIQIQVLLSKLFPLDFKVTGRIKGVKEFNCKNIPQNFFEFIWKSKRRLVWLHFLLCLNLLGTIFLIYVSIKTGKNELFNSIWWIIGTPAIWLIFTTMDFKKRKTSIITLD